MIIYPIEVSETASSGEWSFNTQEFRSAMLKQIVIAAATSTTTFDITITDNKNNVVYRTDTPATGELIIEKEIPLKGIYTIAASNASEDEAFTGRLMVKEEN